MIGLWERVTFAFRCFFSILLHANIPEEIAGKLVTRVAPAPTPPAVAPATRLKEVERSPTETFDRGVQMLALLQRDGRLIDFLSENISPYPDEQLGAAVRSIHESCRQVLQRYVKLEPIVNSEEEQSVTVPADFEPGAIKLIGNVAGSPPIRGVLRHKGWRVTEVNLPPLAQGTGRMVVAPAEVEVP